MIYLFKKTNHEQLEEMQTSNNNIFSLSHINLPFEQPHFRTVFSDFKLLFNGVLCLGP